VFGLFALVVSVFAQPNVAAAVFQGEDLLVQLAFTPLLSVWTIWVAMAISTRMSDVRVAQQLAMLASIPPVLVTVLIALDVIAPTAQLGLGLFVLLAVLDVVGWRLTTLLFDRELLIAGQA